MNRYVLEERYRTIVPMVENLDDMHVWAGELPNMYTVYTTGYITYYDQRALDWFILRWGLPENSVTSAVSLG